MQHTLAYNFAKNVNNSSRPSRRAASAYHLCIPSPHSSSSSLSSLNEECLMTSESNGMYGVPLFSTLGTSASPVTINNHQSTSILPPKTSIEEEVLIVPAVVPLCTQAGESDRDRHKLQRGSTVDKTNPFIGYFRTSATSSNPIEITSTSPSLTPKVPSASPVPIASPVPSSFKESLRGTYQTTTQLLNKPKRLVHWLESSTKRLPSLFNRQQDGHNDGRETTHSGGKPPLVPLTSALPPAGLESHHDEKLDLKTNKTLSEISRTEYSSPSTSLSSFLHSSSRFEQEFKILATLGQGGQGMVYKVQSRVDQCMYAIKKVVFTPTEQHSLVVMDQALREVQAMASLSTHANVVRYHTAWFEKEIVNSTAPGVVPNASCLLSSESLSHTKDPSLSRFDEEGEMSMGGFEFAEPSHVEQSERQVSTLQAVSTTPEKGGDVDMVNALYIQMELCGTVNESVHEENERDSFQRLLHRLTSKDSLEEADVSPTVHSTFASWLRNTLEKRVCPPEDDNFKTHRQGLELFLDVVNGVQHLHEAGFIHRDLKPDNVFLHTQQTQHSQRAVCAKIGDFGLSKSIFSPDDHNVDTMTFSMDSDDLLHTTQLGTFTYASPEQLGYRWNTTSNHTVPDRVKRATYSTQSDIFALGVILLELCSPCTTMMERSQVLTGVRHGVIPQLTRQRYPVEMALVLKMTAMDPSERPSAKEIGQQIRQILMRKSPSIHMQRSKSSHTLLASNGAWNEIRDLQVKLELAVRQLRDRSHATQQLELLIAELHDKVQSAGIALA